jgi:hypothetical protein
MDDPNQNGIHGSISKKIQILRKIKEDINPISKPGREEM